MSQIPRRTSEFHANSAKRSIRNSRLTSSALKPSTSQNRISTITSSNARPSTTFSKVPATPMRTPARTPNKSTGTKERMTIVQMTAEKEKAPIEDRDYLISKSNQILELLSKQDRFNELVQKGLKSMTLKHFISILEYMLTPIIGRVPKDFQTVYVDTLHNILIQLEYPYNINKSSLKTPNAPHCFNNIIVLLGWLAEFSKKNDEPIQYLPADELQDIESIKTFMDQTSEAYKLFNEAKDHSNIEKKMCETFFERRVGPEKDIDSEIERFKHDISHLMSVNKPSTLLKELADKKNEGKRLDDKIEEYNKNIGEYNRKITNLTSTLGYKQQAHENALREKKQLDEQLKTQIMSLEERQNVLIEITRLKSELMSKRNAVVELMETSSENEVILSNLISKKFSLIERLNNLLYKFSSDLDVAGANDRFDPEMFEIKSSKDDSVLEEMINNIHKGLIQLKNQYLRLQSQMKDYKIKIDSEFHECKTQNEFLEVQYEQLEKSLTEVEDKESLAEQQLSALIHSIQINYYEKKDKIKQNEKQINERTKGIKNLEIEIDELKEKRENFGVKAVEECERLYLEKKKEIEGRRQFLKENMKLIDEYHQNEMQIPKHLKGLFDEIVMKSVRNNDE